MFTQNHRAYQGGYLRTAVFMIGVIILVALAVVLWQNAHESKEFNGRFNRSAQSSFDTRGWKTYQSNLYHFRVQYPPHWVATTTDRVVPIVNIYDPHTVTEESGDPPFSHHDNVTHVSFYPKGFPSEGVLGERVRATSSVVRLTNVEETQYVLANGSVWARFIQFIEPPRGWNESSFVWARTAFDDDIEAVCRVDGKEQALGGCDPLLGLGEIEYTGVLDSSAREELNAVLSSFRLTSSAYNE